MQRNTKDEIGAVKTLQFLTDHGPASTPRRPWSAIVLGGLIAGGCDLTYALVFYGAQKVKPIRILQSIASGLLGMSSFQGGWATAALGAFLQFLIASVAAAIYYVASRKIRLLLTRAAICGALYGVVIYFFMHKVVLPLSAAPHFKATPLSSGTDFLVHVFLIGLPIALITRRYGSATRVRSVRPVTGSA